MNKLTGEEYVGKTTKTLEERMRVHFKAMKTSRQFIHRAMVKYGVDNFSWMVLEEVDSNIDEREKYWIEALDTLSPNGYNLSTGGEGGDCWSTLGRGHAQSTKDKIRDANIGKHHSEISRLKMSAQRKGIPKTEAHKEKLRQSLLNRNSKKTQL